jgi:hypothetical protein
MSLTITLTPALIAGVIYALGFCVSLAFFVSDSMSFVNPRYWQDILIALAWPVVIIQVVILAPIFDIYIGDVLRNIKEWWEQFRCDHEKISECGNYEVNGRVGDEICQDCGKVWWEQ